VTEANRLAGTPKESPQTIRDWNEKYAKRADT